MKAEARFGPPGRGSTPRQGPTPLLGIDLVAAAKSCLAYAEVAKADRLGEVADRLECGGPFSVPVHPACGDQDDPGLGVGQRSHMLQDLEAIPISQSDVTDDEF